MERASEQGRPMIAINWGTSNFRAWKVDAGGKVEDERTSGRGALSVLQEKFHDALMAEVGDWVSAGETRVLMSGMVGARNGWKEAPYVPVPASLERVAEAVTRIPADSLDVRIVPGLIGSDDNGIPEVMRGEETEIFGSGIEAALPSHVCLPGTHTKWVRVEGETVAGFSTSMTGDLYRAIRAGTILRASTQQEAGDADAFLLGVARSKQAGELAHHLFGVRTLVLTGAMKEESASSYLSGILIGHEVKANTQKGEPVHLIGETSLCKLYAIALGAYGVDSTLEPEGAALRGLLRIAENLAW
jgi:2-dehydro-3-deoxygalactonokinase